MIDGKGDSAVPRRLIGDFCLVTDYVANGSFASLRQNVQYLSSAGYAVLVRMRDSNNGWNGERVFVSERAYRFLSKSSLKPGDIVVSNVGDPGQVFVVPDLRMPMTLGPNAILVRPRENFAIREYVRHYLRSPLGQAQIDGIVTKTAQRKFNKTEFRALPIPLPPLTEQRWIAAILDKADELRAKRRAALAQLDALPRAMFLDLFGDPSKNPKGWPTKPLAALIREDDSINYGVVQPGNDLDDGVPLIRVGDLLDGRVNQRSLKRIASTIESSYKRSRLRGDEILVSCVGSIGVVALADESLTGFNIARAVARIPLGKTVNRMFIAAYLKSDFVQHYFTNELRTVSQPTLNIKQLSETLITLPPLELQIEFACRVEAIEKLKASHRASLGEMDALFASLQYRAFRGEL